MVLVDKGIIMAAVADEVQRLANGEYLYPT